MPRAFQHQARIDGELSVGYSAAPRRDRGKWVVVFKGADGVLYRLTTVHDVRGKNPPAEFHADAHDLVRKSYRPQTIPEASSRRAWADLIAEVERTGPHIRPDTIRGYRSAAKALAEVLPECPSPSDMSEDRVRRFGKLWLAAPSKKGRGGGSAARSRCRTTSGRCPRCAATSSSWATWPRTRSRGPG